MKIKYTFDELNKIIKSKKSGNTVLAKINDEYFEIEKFFQFRKKDIIANGDLFEDGSPYCGINADIGYYRCPYEEIEEILITKKIKII